MELKPALLTRTEIEWLLGKKEVSKAYGYYLRHSIKEKLQTLVELELPLLNEKDLIGSGELSVFTKDLRANSKASELLITQSQKPFPSGIGLAVRTLASQANCAGSNPASRICNTI